MSDLNAQVTQLAIRAIDERRSVVEAFAREHGATPQTHEFAVYDPADPQPGHFDDKVYALIPKGDMQAYRERGTHPTLAEACARYPNRRIFTEYATRGSLQGQPGEA